MSEESGDWLGVWPITGQHRIGVCPITGEKGGGPPLPHTCMLKKNVICLIHLALAEISSVIQVIDTSFLTDSLRSGYPLGAPLVSRCQTCILKPYSGAGTCWKENWSCEMLASLWSASCRAKEGPRNIKTRDKPHHNKPATQRHTRRRTDRHSSYKVSTNPARWHWLDNILTSVDFASC